MPDMHPKSLLRSQILPMAFFFEANNWPTTRPVNSRGQLVLWDSAKSFMHMFMAMYIYIYTHSYMKTNVIMSCFEIYIYILCLHLCIWNHLNMNIQVCIYIIYTVYIVYGKGRWPFLGTPILFIGSIHLSWDMRLWKDLSMIVLGVVQPSAWSVIAMNLDVFCHIFFSKAGFSYI